LTLPVPGIRYGVGTGTGRPYLTDGRRPYWATGTYGLGLGVQ